MIKENKRKINEIEQQIKDIQRSAQKLVDLTNQIIVYQDTPKYDLPYNVYTVSGYRKRPAL